MLSCQLEMHECRDLLHTLINMNNVPRDTWKPHVHKNAAFVISRIIREWWKYGKSSYIFPYFDQQSISLHCRTYTFHGKIFVILHLFWNIQIVSRSISPWNVKLFSKQNNWQLDIVRQANVGNVCKMLCSTFLLYADIYIYPLHPKAFSTKIAWKTI